MPWVDEHGDGRNTCEVCGRPFEYDNIGPQATGYPFCTQHGQPGEIERRRQDAQPPTRSNTMSDLIALRDSCARAIPDLEEAMREAEAHLRDAKHMRDRVKFRTYRESVTYTRVVSEWEALVNSLSDEIRSKRHEHKNICGDITRW